MQRYPKPSLRLSAALPAPDWLAVHVLYVSMGCAQGIPTGPIWPAYRYPVPSRSRDPARYPELGSVMMYGAREPSRSDQYGRQCALSRLLSATWTAAQGAWITLASAASTKGPSQYAMQQGKVQGREMRLPPTFP